ncbi:MAG: adenylate kinase [Haloarculaceae archaeon]
MDVTVVTGVPGVGTSRVCREARSRLDDGCELLNFGDIMLERAASRGLVESRDDLATLSRREVRLLQRRSAEYVAERARGRAVLLDTHLAVATAHGYLPGLPDAALADVDPDRFVLVEAAPTTVVERREAVETREYRERGPRAVDLHQDLNRAAAMAYAVETASPVRLVENEDDPETAGERLANIVEQGDRSR